MDLNNGAHKLRQAAERESTGKDREAARRESDTKAARGFSAATS